MAILFLIPIFFLFIIWERKKLILYEYVLNKNINIKRRYIILLFISYIVGIALYLSFVNFLSEEHTYNNMKLLLLTPLYIAICSICLLLFEFVLAMLVVFIEHIIIDKLLIKYFKLDGNQIIKFNSESNDHPHKYIFYSNCVGTLFALVLSMLILVVLKYLIKTY